MKSAPRPTANSASSQRVMPQTLIRTAIGHLTFAARQRGGECFESLARMAAAQQALADKKGARARPIETPDIRGRVDSAFRDHQRRTAITGEQPLGHRDIGDESMQVAVVDTDDFSA